MTASCRSKRRPPTSRPAPPKFLHETLEKFGYPHSLVKEYRHWAVLCRPQQVTLGACTIVIKDDIRAVGAVSAEAFAEFSEICNDLERTVKVAFQNDKINYLALMMVDPQVHFHALPRYAEPRDFVGHTFIDTHWPKPPVLGDAPALSAVQLNEIKQKLIEQF